LIPMPTVVATLNTPYRDTCASPDPFFKKLKRYP